VEQVLIDLAAQMPIVAVILLVGWYYRKDMLARIEELEENIQVYIAQRFREEKDKPD